jgi:hypothetical protein
MKPTADQQQFLSKYLSKNLRYRETYTEFYDHILSALETKPDNMPFEDAVESIVTADFGGFEGMSAIEKRYKKTIFKEIQHQYLDRLIACFKSPQAGITVVVTILFYWITKQAWFNFWVFIGIFAVLRMTPRVLWRIRNISAGYIFTRPKRSVKDGVFEWLDYIAPILFAVFIISGAICGYSPIDWFKEVNPAVLALLLVLCALHTLAFYKIYKSEFKTSITR